MSSKTIENWLSNDLCYLVNGCFDLKIDVLQKTVGRVYYILNVFLYLFIN